MEQVLGRYDARILHGLLEEAGVFRTLETKGFGRFEVVIESAGRALPHTLLYGHKDGIRFLLLDACLGEAVVRPDFFSRRGYAIDGPIELLVVHWIREEDPTVAFRSDRPRLPLQRHPGLGILRRAFRVATRIATDLDKDAIASIPKFFHDAVIFYRSRLFLFLDGSEQGRFEALARDVQSLPLDAASAALLSGCVRDALGVVVEWSPGYQVFPLSERLTAYFHSAPFAAQVADGTGQCRFTWDADAVARVRQMLRAQADEQ